MALLRKKARTLTTAALASICAAGLTAGVALADMNGVDVSGWQPASITQTVPGDFAIVKATEGTGYRNGSWAAQVAGAITTGKATGVYHYADGGNAVAEADAFLATVSGYVGRSILVLDWEQYRNASWGDGSWITTWVNRVHDRTQVWPVVYVQRSAVWQVPSYVRQHCMLWVAQYASNATTGYQDNPWNAGASGEGMIQYTSSGRLPGYSGNLDLSRFFGDRTAWQKIACGERSGCSTASAGTTAKPEATTTPTPTPSTSKSYSYVVRSGDTVSAIAARLGLYPVSAWTVPSGNPGLIYPGQTITYHGTSSGSTAAATTTATRSYVVRSGDTVSAIAARLGLYPVSAWTVPSGNPGLIYPGQTITYHGTAASTTASASTGHTVKAGESLYSIYGSGWQAAAQRNSLCAPYTIYPGQRLR